MAALVQSPDLFKVYAKMGHEYGLPILLEQTGTPWIACGNEFPADETLFSEWFLWSRAWMPMDGSIGTRL